jgi:hypothetical protein
MGLGFTDTESHMAYMNQGMHKASLTQNNAFC